MTGPRVAGFPDHPQRPLPALAEPAIAFCGNCGQMRSIPGAPFCAVCGAPVGHSPMAALPALNALNEQYGGTHDGQQRPTLSAPRGPTRRIVIGGGAVALAIVAAVVFAVTRNGSGNTIPLTFSMSGSQTLIDTSFLSDSGGRHGINGYADIYAGTNITVYNNVGTIVGVGGLADGVAAGSGQCYFTFSVTEIRAGQGPYQWEVAHRGRLTITEAHARAGKAYGTLGG